VRRAYTGCGSDEVRLGLVILLRDLGAARLVAPQRLLDEPARVDGVHLVHGDLLLLELVEDLAARLRGHLREGLEEDHSVDLVHHRLEGDPAELLGVGAEPDHAIAVGIGEARVGPRLLAFDSTEAEALAPGRLGDLDPLGLEEVERLAGRFSDLLRGRALLEPAQRVRVALGEEHLHHRVLHVGREGGERLGPAGAERLASAIGVRPERVGNRSVSGREIGDEGSEVWDGALLGHGGDLRERRSL
jgi:hypothetical protein